MAPTDSRFNVCNPVQLVVSNVVATPIETAEVTFAVSMFDTCALGMPIVAVVSLMLRTSVPPLPSILSNAENAFPAATSLALKISDPDPPVKSERLSTPVVKLNV